MKPETMKAMRRFVPDKLWQKARKLKRKYEFKKIKAQSSPISKRQLIDDFIALGIQPGDLLYIHSSLRSLGFVEGGADTVIDALLEAIGREGTLAFPTFTIMRSMVETMAENAHVFDPVNSHSTVGMITNVFRMRPGVLRSHHPTHSVAAFGPLAEELTKTHLENGFNFGKGTPFEKLLLFDGKIMGIGVNLAPATLYHTYEDLHLDRFPEVYLPEMYTAKIKLPDGLKEVSIRCHNPEFHVRRIDKVPEIEEYFSSHFKSRGLTHYGPIGNSTSWWMRARDLIDGIDELCRKGITIYSTPNMKK